MINCERADDINAMDPVCPSHGMPWNANPPHWAGKCLICQLCFKVLNSLEECNPIGDMYEDVCIDCARREQEAGLKPE